MFTAACSDINYLATKSSCQCPHNQTPMVIFSNLKSSQKVVVWLTKWLTLNRKDLDSTPVDVQVSRLLSKTLNLTLSSHIRLRKCVQMFVDNTQVRVFYEADKIRKLHGNNDTYKNISPFPSCSSRWLLNQSCFKAN